MSNWHPVCWHVTCEPAYIIREIAVALVSVTGVGFILCLSLRSMVVFPSRNAWYRRRMVSLDVLSSPWLVCKESKHPCTFWSVRTQWRASLCKARSRAVVKQIWIHFARVRVFLTKISFLYGRSGKLPETWPDWVKLIALPFSDIFLRCCLCSLIFYMN